MKSILRFTLGLLVLSGLASPVTAAILSYNYDAAGRLTAVNYNGASRTTYGYDKNGSLLTRANSTTPALTPSPHFAATFNGLVTNGLPDASNSGVITLKLLANGVYSGKFTVGGLTVSFKGSFDAAGGSVQIPIIGKAPLTSLDLSLDVLGAAPSITGTLTANGFASEVALEAASYNTKTNPLPAGFIGKYTALFMPTENAPDIPQGDGYAIVNIKNNGSVSLAGKLADNSKVTHGSFIAGSNRWPIFVLLNKKSGFLSGEVVLATDPGVSDFEGSLSWLKPATSGDFHPDAFITSLDLLGARYLPPLKGQRALLLADVSPNAVFTASGGGLIVDPFERNVTLDSKNKFIVTADSSALKLSFASATGLFTGSFKENSSTRSFGGVLLQTLNRGSGFFTGSAKSGLVEIEEAP